MPITLTSPISGPVVAKKEVTGFSIDLSGGMISIQFADLTAQGETVGQSSGGCSLYAPDGTPRFTQQEYASIKAAVYRLALADGIVAGAVD
jgi:hypothetical protein